jgi:hypothetical protein
MVALNREGIEQILSVSRLFAPLNASVKKFFTSKSRSFHKAVSDFLAHHLLTYFTIFRKDIRQISISPSL